MILDLVKSTLASSLEKLHLDMYCQQITIDNIEKYSYALQKNYEKDYTIISKECVYFITCFKLFNKEFVLFSKVS